VHALVVANMQAMLHTLMAVVDDSTAVYYAVHVALGTWFACLML